MGRRAAYSGVKRYILDASALMALLLLEPGGDVVANVIGTGVISAVNLSEAISKLQQKGMALSEAIHAVRIFQLHVEPFDEKLALSAAALRAPTMQFGLSFADRACLAAAQHMNLAVMTADKIWAKLDLGIEIKLIR